MTTPEADAVIAPVPVGRRVRPRWIMPLLVVLALVLPIALFKGYTLANLSMVFIFAVALMGMVLLTGHGGQISLGHGAFFAAGAYCTAILMDRWNVPYWATFPVSGALCFLLGWLFGLPALRLPGHHLALATFALAMAAPQLLRYSGFEAWTHGTSGITVAAIEAPPGVPLKPDQWLFLCAVVLYLLMYAFSRGLAASRMGRAIRAIRDNPTAAVAMGIDSGRVKSITFGISTLYTGLAGSAAALVWQFAAPDSFSVMLSLSLFVGAVAGGLMSFTGVLAGAALIQYLPNLTEQISQSAPTTVYGILLIAMMFVLPDGVAGGIARARNAIRARREKAGEQRALVASGEDPSNSGPFNPPVSRTATRPRRNA